MRHTAPFAAQIILALCRTLNERRFEWAWGRITYTDGKVRTAVASTEPLATSRWLQ